MEFIYSNQSGMYIGILFWLAITLWIWAVIDIFRLSRNSYERPGVWLLLIVLFPILGSILFFQIGRKRMKESKRVFNPDFRRN